MTRTQFRQLERVNKELWILLSLFGIALLLNQVFASQRMVLGFYVLPTLGSAYLYGKRPRHAHRPCQRADGCRAPDVQRRVRREFGEAQLGTRTSRSGST